jgi:hypothetical protein
MGGWSLGKSEASCYQSPPRATRANGRCGGAGKVVIGFSRHRARMLLPAKAADCFPVRPVHREKWHHIVSLKNKVTTEDAKSAKEHEVCLLQIFASFAFFVVTHLLPSKF